MEPPRFQSLVNASNEVTAAGLIEMNVLTDYISV